MRLVTVLAASLLVGLCACDPETTDEVTSTGWSCSDYEIMLDVEYELAQQCSSDSECGQVLSGTGCGCETDDLVASTSFDTTYLTELRDEADDVGCTYSVPTTCSCPAATGFVCDAGTCAWD